MMPTSPESRPQSSPLLEQTRQLIRKRHMSIRTEEAYLRWIEQYLRYHEQRRGEWVHPAEMSDAEINEFLSFKDGGCLVFRPALSFMTALTTPVLCVLHHVSLSSPAAPLPTLNARQRRRRSQQPPHDLQAIHSPGSVTLNTEHPASDRPS